jgi:hypothetical protein
MQILLPPFIILFLFLLCDYIYILYVDMHSLENMHFCMFHSSGRVWCIIHGTFYLLFIYYIEYSVTIPSDLLFYRVILSLTLRLSLILYWWLLFCWWWTWAMLMGCSCSWPGCAMAVCVASVICVYVWPSESMWWCGSIPCSCSLTVCSHSVVLHPLHRRPLQAPHCLYDGRLGILEVWAGEHLTVCCCVVCCCCSWFSMMPTSCNYWH